jgi:hypothetical protein
VKGPPSKRDLPSCEAGIPSAWNIYNCDESWIYIRPLAIRYVEIK